MPFDPRAAFRDDPLDVWDGLEDVTYFSRRTAAGTGGDAADSPVSGLRRALSDRQVEQSAGRYVSGDLVLLLPAKHLSVEPKPADYWEDAQGTRYTVLEAAQNTWRTWWRCVSRNPRVAFDLRQKADVQRPSNAQDAAAGRVPLYETVYPQVDVRVHEAEAEAELVQGARGMRRRYRVFTAGPLLVGAEYRVVCEGVAYTVTGHEQPEHLGGLMHLDCERLP